MMPKRYIPGELRPAPDLDGLPKCVGELYDSIAIVVRGISLSSWNDSQDLKTAMDAHRLACEYACDPNLRKRLSEDDIALHNVQEHIWAAEHQAREAQSSKGMGCLVVVGILIVLGVIGSCNSGTESSRSNSYRPPAVTPTRYPAYDAERAEIESERAILKAQETELEKLGREIETDRLYLDQTSRYAVQAFNEKVDRYNAIVQRAKLANATFNQKVDNYNAKLRQYGR